MRVVLGVEYNGSHFCGWQRQSNAVSVQQKLEDAVSSVADQAITIHAAGRTDTGVHATEQVVHFDCDNKRDQKAWIQGVNSNVPNSISVLWAQEVVDDFHARYSAISRRYRYIILNRRTRPALLDQHVTWEYLPLNIVNMKIASEFLLGEHDFTSYRAMACQAKSPVRTIYDINITNEGDLIFLDIHANGFLHHMVRNIAGVLLSIAKGEQDPDWSKFVLEQRDRTLGGVTADAAGLYLVKVHYDAKFGLDENIKWPSLYSFEHG